MATTQQAPQLNHKGKKMEKNTPFYQLPQDIMDIIFNQLDGKNGNQMKIMTVLLGTAGDGSFRVSEKWICERTGMLQPAYIRARKALVERGWLQVENGHIYLLLDEIRAQGITSGYVRNKDITSGYAKGITSGSEDITSCYDKAYSDVMYNIKEYKNNKKEIEKEPIILESGTWIEKFNAIHNYNTDWGKEAISLLKDFSADEAQRVVLILQDKYNIIFK